MAAIFAAILVYLSVVYYHYGSDADQVVQLRRFVRRQIDAAVAAAVLVDVAAEIGSPAGVVQSVSVAEEAHPVAYEAFVVGLALLRAAADKLDVPCFVVDGEDAGRRAVTCCYAAGYTVAFEFLLAVLEVDDMLFRQVYVDICVSKIESLGVFAVSCLGEDRRAAHVFVGIDIFLKLFRL